jgi:CRISPR-associated endonuclease Cas1
MAARVEYRHEQRRDYGTGQARLRKRGPVVVACGYSLSITVERGRLIVKDGAARQRRERSFGRGFACPSRLVVLGSAGVISLQALRWLADQGVGFLHLDRDGRLLTSSATTGLDDPRLRRAQALASGTPVGLEIARALVAAKVSGQLALLNELSACLVDEARATVEQAQADVNTATHVMTLRLAEAQAAAAYWRAWAELPLRFARRDESRLPEHWLHVGQRSSPLTGSPRLAVTPTHALANYLYSLAEGEARLALLAVGLDPGLGVMHADQKARDSLALDLLEPLRPEIDHFLLRLLCQRTFRATDFYETRRGGCRVLPPLTLTLAETIPTWAEQLAPLAEQVAEMLVGGQPTPLTQTKRSAGRGHQRRGTPASHPSRPRLPSSCRTCGAALIDANRAHCDDCLPLVRAEQKRGFSAAGPAALTRLRADNLDPAHGGQAAKRRSETMRRRKQEEASWSELGSAIDAEQFTREVLPAIQGVPLRRLVEATGLSLRYCALIRRGERVPHQRHWLNLAAVAPRQ